MKKALALLLAFTLTLQLTLLTSHTVVAQEQDFNIVNVNVWSSTGTACIYPGSRKALLKVEAKYLNVTSARSVVGQLIPVEGISLSSETGALSPARLLNGSFAEEVSFNTYITFEYSFDVSSSLSPNNYEMQLNITYVKGESFIFETHLISITVSPYPAVSLRVVDAHFSPASFPGSVDTSLYVIFENLGHNTINSANFNLELPANFTVRNPRASTGLVNSGERFTLTFTGVAIPLNAQVGVYNATVHADVNARSEDEVAYTTETKIEVPVLVENPPAEEPIMVAAVNVLYGGASAPLLPSARGVVLRIYLINRLPDTISAMAITKMTLPIGLLVKSISGTYINGMASGGTCFVDLSLDVDSALAFGVYGGTLNLSYVRIVSGSSFVMSQTVNFPIAVESFHSYTPELTVASAYWGYPDPTPAYSNSRYIPLTLRIANQGAYPVQGVVVNASSSELISIKDSEACAATLASGGYCTAVLYFDINTSLSDVQVNVHLSYFFAEFGTHKLLIRNCALILPIERFPGSEGILSVVGAGWQNNLSVFPKTSNATYQITLANRTPYSISGVKLSLKLPYGMSSKGQSEAAAYVEGPVRSLAAFTVAFTISVGDVMPADYNANLTVDCLLLSGGPGVRRVENFTLQIGVSDDSSALEVVDSRWYEGSVGPNTYGAHLIVLIRNVYVDGLHGAVLQLELPEGIRNAGDNSSEVKATPLSLQLPQQLQAADIAEILGTFVNVQEAISAQVYSRGDILTFIASLNLFNIEVGAYTLNGQLTYIDSWGCNRKIAIAFPIVILGRAGYIDVFIDKSLSVRSRCVNTSLTLVNCGSSPAYDAYIIVQPHQSSPMLIASPAVNHVEKIAPGENRQIPLTLAFNPLGVYSQSGVVTVTYGPVPLLVSIFYRDASGYYQTFNNSITVIVEPFIDLAIRSVKATGTAFSSTATGIIINYGSSTARSVEVQLRIGEAEQSSFIGDVDPSSEVAFRVDLNRYNATARLAVRYYNVFNEQETIETDVNVELREEAAPTPVQAPAWTVESWVIVAGVLLFLAVATLILYKMMRKTKFAENP